MYSGKYGTFNCIRTDYLVEVNDDGQRTLLPDENDQQSAWPVRLRERKVCLVAAVGRLLCSLANRMEAGQHRKEDEEVITLGNTPEAWSWQTAADRS